MFLFEINLARFGRSRVARRNIAKGQQSNKPERS